YHGPKGYIRFAPKWNAADFKAPFTAAEGWGTYSQKQSNGAMKCILEPKYGQIQLSSFSVDTPKGRKAGIAAVSVNSQTIPVELKQKDENVLLTFQRRVTVKDGEKLSIRLATK
ncbi:MAG: hypothetical protein LBS42_01520, partial [Tannerella sp.]|nr:hypothetical protein [Tannerella sp.]